MIRGGLGLEALAADRSMRATLDSGDMVAVAASARIIIYALMSGRHLLAAVATATSYAARLDRDLRGQPSRSLSVYGALLLRRSQEAVVAAQADDRGSPPGSWTKPGKRTGASAAQPCSGR